MQERSTDRPHRGMHHERAHAGRAFREFWVEGRLADLGSANPLFQKVPSAHCESKHNAWPSLEDLQRRSYSLNPLQGVICGILWRSIIGVIKGDTSSLDYRSDEVNQEQKTVGP